MQSVHPPRSQRKLQKAMSVMALIVILSGIGITQATVTFTLNNTFATPLLGGKINSASNDQYSNMTAVDSLNKFKDSRLSTLASSYTLEASPTSTSPNSTTTSELESTQLSDEAYTILLIVCFTAVLVAISLMIAAVELNQWRHRKITL